MSGRNDTSNRVTVTAIYYLPNNCFIGPEDHSLAGKTTDGGRNGVPSNHANVVVEFDLIDSASLNDADFPHKVTKRLKDMADISAVSATAAYLFTNAVQQFNRGTQQPTEPVGGEDDCD